MKLLLLTEKGRQAAKPNQPISRGLLRTLPENLTIKEWYTLRDLAHQAQTGPRQGLRLVSLTEEDPLEAQEIRELIRLKYIKLVEEV